MKIIKIKNCIQCPKSFVWQNGKLYCSLCTIMHTDTDLYDEYGINNMSEVSEKKFPTWCPLDDDN